MEGVYVKENMGEMLQELGRWVGEKEGKVEIIIGGDFNARTREEGGRVGSERENKWGARKERGNTRRSKDKKVNKEGKMLVKFLEERG